MHTVPTDVLRVPIMSPNYYMVFAALATQSVAAFAPSTMRLRGTARAMPPDEGWPPWFVGIVPAASM